MQPPLMSSEHYSLRHFAVQEGMRMTERQRYAIVLVYEAMMRELSSIFARHQALLASLSTARPAATAKTNGVRMV